MIIDAHVHVKGGDTYRREFSAEHILQTMDEAGIDKSVIFSICLPGRESNELTQRCYEQCPERFIPFAHVLPEDGRRAIVELERCAQQLGWKGLKLHVGEMAEASSEPLKYVCAAAQEMDLAVLIDFGTRLDIATELIEALPELKLLVAHLGAPNQEVLVEKFISLALDYPAIYMDASYSAVAWKIKDTIDAIGADRVVFGSDGPLIHPAIDLMKIKVCHLSDEDFEKVTWRNIERILS